MVPRYESTVPNVVGGRDLHRLSACSLKAADKAADKDQGPRIIYAANVRQRDILDDGEPPRPRAGWPVRHLILHCLIQELDNLPSDMGSGRLPYFFVEVRVGDNVYKTQVCQGDELRRGYVRFNQLIKAQVDDEVLEAVSKSINSSEAGSAAPCLTITCFDCSLRFKDKVVGRVVFSMANMLELNSEGWHEIFCNFVDIDGNEVFGYGGDPATLSLAIHIDERCKIKVVPLSFATFIVVFDLTCFANSGNRPV